MKRYQELAAALGGDGCSQVPDLYFRPCCDAHDVHYRTGRDADGNPITRREADSRFLKCMRESGKTFIGRHVVSLFYWAGVRLFGGSDFNEADNG